jgi:hypothetical protein
MDEFELEQLRRHPKWVAILELYQRIHSQNRDQIPDFDGWVPRLQEVPETPNEELPGIHGKLIAFGFLKFDLAGRDGGIRYQLSPLGKQAISGPASSDLEESTSGVDLNADVLAVR